MNIVFFKRPKPKKFNYVPRYYDAEKEELERRKKELGLLEGGDQRELFKAEMRRKWRAEGDGKSDRSNMVRIIMYLFVLFISVYLFFFTDFIGKLVYIFSGR